MEFVDLGAGFDERIVDDELGQLRISLGDLLFRLRLIVLGTITSIHRLATLLSELGRERHYLAECFATLPLGTPLVQLWQKIAEARESLDFNA